MGETPITADELRDVIAMNLGVGIDEVTDGATLESLGADSLDVLEVWMELEKYAGVFPGDDAWMKCRNVGDYIHTVLRAAKEPPFIQQRPHSEQP